MHSSSFSDGASSNLALSLGGFFMSAGVVIPGVSSSVILMICGIYETYLTAIATVNLAVLIPLGAGVIIGSIIFLMIINFLFKYFRSYTYYAIIGFTLGSILVLFPEIGPNVETFIGICLFFACFIISRFFEKLA